MADNHTEPLSKKSDLQYDYPKSTTSGDDPKNRGEPDSSLLNRDEWYEMRYFCNKFANGHKVGDMSKYDIARKTERIIKEHLPGDVRSHENVTKWIVENWKHYPKA